MLLRENSVMHARIKELVIQSGFDTRRDTVIVDGVDITRTVENLAELIVRECMSVIGEENYGMLTGKANCTELKRHFGVK
jgi:hypothetical protein